MYDVSIDLLKAVTFADPAIRNITLTSWGSLVQIQLRPSPDRPSLKPIGLVLSSLNPDRPGQRQPTDRLFCVRTGYEGFQAIPIGAISQRPSKNHHKPSTVFLMVALKPSHSAAQNHQTQKTINLGSLYGLFNRLSSYSLYFFFLIRRGI